MGLGRVLYPIATADRMQRPVREKVTSDFPVMQSVGRLTWIHAPGCWWLDKVSVADVLGAAVWQPPLRCLPSPIFQTKRQPGGSFVPQNSFTVGGIFLSPRSGPPLLLKETWSKDFESPDWIKKRWWFTWEWAWWTSHLHPAVGHC